MRKSVLGWVLGLAIGTAGIGATPAAANEDLGNFLFGALTLLAIGNMIENNSTAEPAPRYVPTKPRKGYIDEGRVHRKMRLPNSCTKHVETRRGVVRMMGRKCLQNNFRYVNTLPQACKIKVRNLRGNIRHGFLKRCLRKSGYVFS